MDAFSQKLRLIYNEIFHQNIDEFTKAFIDEHKYKSQEQSKKEFFSNRKTVLRRWLAKNITCTNDFKKSFTHYAIAKCQMQGKALFTLDDFQSSDNILAFEEKVEAYLRYQQRVHIRTDYQYIYMFNESHESIYAYQIKEWRRGEGSETHIVLLSNGIEYEGTFSIREDDNIFITLEINEINLYLLFHDTHDKRSNYIVGVGMGYTTLDNKVPRAEKVLLAKQELEEEDIELQFILNETESVVAVENRFTLHTEELKISPLMKFSNTFSRYHNFFSRLVKNRFSQSFYHRLAFKEFYAFHRLFERVVRQESYFINNYQRAFLEMMKTVERIGDIPLHIVTELNNDNLFLQYTPKDMKIKEQFLKLSTFGIRVNMIFIIESIDSIPKRAKNILQSMKKVDIAVRLVEREKIVHEVNSLDFFFIHLNDSRDFVMADPIRDNKDVFKLFVNEVTMDEYRTDYRLILEESEEV